MNDLDTLVRHIRGNLDLSTASPDDAYPYAAVPLCAIDAVFSLGVRYESTWRTVGEWCTRHSWEMCRWKATVERTTTDFMRILQPYDACFEAMARSVFNNRQLTSPISGILKAKAVYMFADVLCNFGVETLSDALFCEVYSDLRTAVQNIPGQGSGLSYNYFLMLTGHKDAVKADRMVRRFVSCALCTNDVRAQRAEELVREASGRLRSEFPDLTPSLLDNEIWKYERDRKPGKTIKPGRPLKGRHRITPWVKAARDCAGHKPKV